MNQNPTTRTYDSASYSEFRRNLHTLLCHKSAAIAGVVLLIFFVTAMLVPVLLPRSPSAPDLANALESPSKKYLLGTDELGRSILVRILYGARVSLLIAMGAVSVGFFLGVPLGLISGYYRGKVDFIIQRLTDMMLAFPAFLLALALVAALGVGLRNTIISIGVSMVPIYIRLVRGSALSVREEVYVEAAKAVGTRDKVILIRHILPNLMAPIIIQTSLGMAMSIIYASGLGFLGVGVQPPTPEWGAMLGSARVYMLSSPHVATFPGIAIFLAVLSFNMLGDGLRDALDPKLRL